jgi:signal transduction histidine kinase
MILSVRHRILIPFVLITIFMAFFVMLTCFEFLQNYVNQQTQLKGYQAPIAIHAPFIDLPLPTTTYQAKHHPTMGHVLQEDNHAPMPITTFLPPKNKWPTNLHAIYIESNGQLYNAGTATPIRDNTSLTNTMKLRKNGQLFHRIRRPHPTIQKLYMDIDIYSGDIYQRYQLALAGSFTIILLINTLIVIIFSRALNFMTISLSKITTVAKKLANGQKVTPIEVKTHDEFGQLAQSINHMIHTIHTKTSTIIDQKNQSKMMIDALPESIIFTDTNHALMMANRQAEALFAFSNDTAKGPQLLNYLRQNVFPKVWAELKQPLASAPIRQSITLPNQNGRYESYQLTLSPLHHPPHKKIGILTVIYPIQPSQHTALLHASTLHADINKLRTPLTVIDGFLTRLKNKKDGPLTEKQESILSVSLLNNKKLARHTQYLLDLLMIQLAPIKLIKAAHKINALVSDIHGQVTPMMASKKNTLSLHFNANEMSILLDQKHVKNALQTITIYMHEHTHEDAMSWTVSHQKDAVTIMLHAPKMVLTSDQIQSIKTTLEFTPSGPTKNPICIIELMLSNKLIQQHDGHIVFKSHPDHGTSFLIHLPYVSGSLALNHLNYEEAIDNALH